MIINILHLKRTYKEHMDAMVELCVVAGIVCRAYGDLCEAGR
jgi:hypothetical protein